jgi:hypothetical protein
LLRLGLRLLAGPHQRALVAAGGEGSTERKKGNDMA